MEWHPEEVRDYGGIIDWIAAQPWSNGRVGTYGVSYEGNTAILATVPNRPALKVAAPLYGDFNPLLGLIQPGGARNTYADAWGKAVGMMDRNDVCGLAGIQGLQCWFTRLLVPGVRPVDGPEGEALLGQAVEQHRANADVGKETAKIRYLDDRYGQTSLTMASVAPFGLKERIEAAAVPLIIHAGWTDAATVDGVLSQFMTFSNPQQVLLGAFTHGGRQDTDPCFLRADALPLVENQITGVAFSLMATSVRIEAGHRLRIALAGADHDMFVPRPAGGDVTWQVHRSASHPSYVDIPVQ